MCIIAVKKKGVKLPDNFIGATIRACTACNRDGAGFALKRAGEDTILLSKGFFTVEALQDELSRAKITREDEFIFHARMATAGLTNMKNCHPFPITTDRAVMDTTSGFLRIPVLAHNGIFSEFHGRGKQDPHSDTYYFTRDFLATYDRHEGKKRALKKWRHRFRRYLGGNKLAIMYPKRELEVLGSYVITHAGMLYSNGGYKSYNYSDINSAFD